MMILKRTQFLTFLGRCYLSQKVTKEHSGTKITNPLTDTFGRRHTYLRISLTERCNLRCSYCMPMEGVVLTEKLKILTANEIIYISKLFAKKGVTKIRLTGGEPTVRKDLVLIIENLKQIYGIESVAMTTNGLVLTRQLVSLQMAGLDGINISLDTLKEEKYELITRRKGWNRVLMGIDLALQLGYNPVKINCVVMKGFNEEEVVDFVEFTKDRKVDVRFIEYMPFTGNRWESEKMISYAEMLRKIRTAYTEIEQLENGPNDTSKAWKVMGYEGQFGFITSMSDHFCGTCNRLRITADGNLKVCLFGNTEISLRDAIRSGCTEDDLTALISSAVQRKKKQHAGHVKWVHVANNHKTINFIKNIPPLYGLNQKSLQFISARGFSTRDGGNLTHVDKEGNFKMVDVAGKEETARRATAKATVNVPYEVALLIQNNTNKKGDVLSVAKFAGITGAKKTAELIPLCHNINLTNIDVKATFSMDRKTITILATVSSFGRTGVEMEALSAVAIAALTVYDMCKAASHDITISNIYLVDKSGGASGNYKKNELKVRAMNEISIEYNKGDQVIIGNI